MSHRGPQNRLLIEPPPPCWTPAGLVLVPMGPGTRNLIALPLHGPRFVSALEVSF